MSPASKKAALGGSCSAFRAKNATRIQASIAEILENGVAGSIITNHTKGQHLCAESSDIVRGVGSPSGDHLCFAMLQDQVLYFLFDRRVVNRRILQAVTQRFIVDKNFGAGSNSHVAG